MKKNLIRTLIFFLVCTTLSVLIYYPHYKKENNLLIKREQLSKEMGVSLEKYPYLPDDYFSDTLKMGMTIDEIHTIVVGYEKVYHSFDKQEIYYYFSGDDKDANRVLIGYNEEFKVEKIVQEDENSRTLTVTGWDEGLLEK